MAILHNTVKFPTTIALAIVACIVAGGAMSAVYAQEVDSETGIELGVIGYVVAALTFVAGGLYYTCLGYFRKWRRAMAGEHVKFDMKKVRNSIILGLVVGIAAFVASEYSGEAIQVTNMNEFVEQALINVTAVMTIDKLILGRARNTNTNITPKSGKTAVGE